MSGRLFELYKGRLVYHGELHDHSNSGGTSDGKQTLSFWKERLAELKMDFAAILDHRQVRHMYLPEWEDGLFIAGTEPGTTILDSRATVKDVHYNMLFQHRDELEKLLLEFPQYEFEGGIEGHFKYPKFTRESFGELIDAVRAHGGHFVHPHPKQLMVSDDPLDYWFRDETGIEVVYISLESEETKVNYKLWCDLLALGKRVWASAGCDLHNLPSDKALTTVYASERSSKGFVERLRVGDYKLGSVGIRMCIGDMLMGSHGKLDDNKLEVVVSDFHPSVIIAEHKYRLDIITQDGVINSVPVAPDEENHFVFDIPKCDFVRCEVFDEDRALRIAIGNPIWIDK